MSAEVTQVAESGSTEPSASASVPEAASTDIKTEDASVTSTTAATTEASSEVKAEPSAASSGPTIADRKKAAAAAKPPAAAKKVGARKMVINDDDDDAPPAPKPAASTPAPKPAAPKPSSAPAPKKAAAAPVKKEETPAKPKPAPKKRKREESEDDDDDDSASESESYESDKPKKSAKKAATKKETPKKTKEPAKKKQKGDSGEPVKKPAKKAAAVKKEGEASQEEVYKWWERDPDDERVWTKSLRHHGVLFPPAYVPHGIKMKYNGEPVDLPPEAEEIATYFSRYLTTPHVQKTQFCANFFKDFLKVLNKKSKVKSKIEKFELCDFTPIAAYLETEKEKKKTRTKEEKEAEKKQKAELKEKYGWAEVDGRREPLGNYMIEPPGLFLGRGDHPKTGRLKKRIMPEDVTLNLDKDAPVPECPIPGHKWGAIQHNQDVAWIATWRENIADNNKYVLFAASSSIRGRSDRDKFETARTLRKHIDEIRAKYEAELDSDELKIQQRATAMWVIDRLALRVGNEKGEDEADTVGCCSLRVEHVTLEPPRTVVFDFLGKDSMRYHNAVEVTEKVFRNFRTFCSGKKPTEDIFDQLTTTFLNKHLTNCMPGLTAKVFRTFNASFTLEKELRKLDQNALNKMTPDEKVLAFNRANREVAILCNHQRTVNAKSHDTAMSKIQETIADLEAQKEELEDALHGKKGKKSDKNEKKRKRDDDDDGGDDAPESKKRKIPDDPEKIKKKIKEIEARIGKWEVKKEEKEDLKTVALSTSKINYIDPRITIAWCKKNNVDIKKVFSKGVRDKFPWAFAEIDATPDYEF